MKSLHWIAAALAAPLFLAGQAMADFSYVTAISPTSATFGGSTVSFDPVSQTGLSGNQGLQIASITDTTGTAPPATDTGAIAFTDTVTISQPSGGAGMGTLTIYGVLTFTRSDTGGQSSSFALDTTKTSILTTTIAGTTYTLSGLAVNPFTVNRAGSGNLGGNLVVTTVPEPASMALIGVGGLLLAAPRLRRLVRRIGRS